MPGRINPFDQPDDFFRIRLISTILETCGMFFNKGAAGKKLDYFLSFFQYYIHTKNPLPMDIEFLVQDIFALTRPQWKLASNIEEATKVFQLAVVQDQKTSGLDKVVEQDDRTSETSSDDENDMPLAEQEDDEESSSEDGEVEADVGRPSTRFNQLTWTNDLFNLQDAEHEPSYNASESEEEAIVVTREEEEIDPQDEADFDREYAKIMAESFETRKFQPKQQFDIPLPVRPKNREVPSGSETAESGPSTPSGMMAFSLLTKRGNRQQVSGSPFVALSMVANMTDPHGRTAVGLDLCRGHDHPTTGREGGAAAHQESGTQLRFARERGNRW
jgi:regulator of nonsense transcripts 2